MNTNTRAHRLDMLDDAIRRGIATMMADNKGEHAIHCELYGREITIIIRENDYNIKVIK